MLYTDICVIVTASFDSTLKMYICKDPADFNPYPDAMKDKFKERGYKQHQLHIAVEKLNKVLQS